MTFQSSENIFGSISLNRYKLISLLIFISAVLFPFGNAWTYESFDAKRVLHHKPEISSVVRESCKYLLKVNNNISARTLTPHNQRNAGKIAALGIVLGARFAIEPNDKEAKNIDNSAQAIIRFRKCHKENMLNIMASIY